MPKPLLTDLWLQGGEFKLASRVSFYNEKYQAIAQITNPIKKHDIFYGFINDEVYFPAPGPGLGI